MEKVLQSEIKFQNQIDELLKSMPKFVRGWYAEMRLENKSLSSCYDYLCKVKKFLEYISNDTQNMMPDEITLSACESYYISSQTKITNDGIETYTSDSYRKGIRSSLTSLLKYLCKNKYIDYNYMEDIPIIKSPIANSIGNDMLNQSDFNKILSAAKKRSNYMNGILINRDVLIILLFMTTGIKKTAMSEISIEDINLKDKTLTIQDKKFNSRIYYLDKQTIKYIKRWLKDRECISNQDSGNALFLSADGKRLGDDTIYNIVKQCCEKGIGKSLPPHKLRAGFCSILYEKTHDIELVNSAAGNMTIKATKDCINLNKQKAVSQIMSNVIKIK